MPCQEIFDQQQENYQKILKETNMIVSIEASETDFWKKYTRAKWIKFWN